MNPNMGGPQQEPHFGKSPYMLAYMYVCILVLLYTPSQGFTWGAGMKGLKKGCRDAANGWELSRAGLSPSR